MKIKPKRSGKSDFIALYNKAFEETVLIQKGDPKRLYNLRCSQLPYCPRSVIINYGTRGSNQPVDLSMAYYTSVGTTVHTVMQTYLPMSGRFLADYECKECGKKYPLSHKYECCDVPTQYEELTIDIGTVNGKNGIQGHIDGVFRDSAGHYWIVDFKTCTAYGAAGKERDPGAAYTRQVRAYAVLLKKQYGIRVKGVMLAFIPRDNPRKLAVWERELTDQDFKDGHAELKADKKLHRRTMVAQSLDELMDLANNKCGSPYCDHCKKSKSDLKGIFTRILKRKVLPIID